MNSSTNASSWARRCLHLVLGALLLAIGAGLYAGSGLPRPWASATRAVHEVASFQRFTSLSKVIQRVGEEGTADQFRAALREAGVSFDGNVGEFEGEQLRLLEQMGPCETVVIGQGRDENGMVWAITRRGDLLKILP